jgi:hypothetical protein
MTDRKLCKHLCYEKVLLNNILNYVLHLNIDFMIEYEHVTKIEFEVKIMLKY